jgi:hypothetical protein
MLIRRRRHAWAWTHPFGSHADWTRVSAIRIHTAHVMQKQRKEGSKGFRDFESPTYHIHCFFWDYIHKKIKG